MRCFTIVIACGWLLLTAPKRPDGSFDTSQPLSKWEQISFFDTARDCNSAISETFRTQSTNVWAQRIRSYQAQGMEMEEAMKKALEDSGPELRRIGEAQSKLQTASRCLPSDSIKFPLK